MAGATERAAVPPSAASASHARLVIGATALVALTVGLNIGALGPALPALHARLHASIDQLGILFGASFAGSLLTTLILGPLLDRRALRPPLIAGCAVLALGLALLPLATSLIAATAALTLAGIGAGTNGIGSTVLAARLFGHQGGRALAVINMCFGLGAFAGPLVAAAVLDATHDYRPLFSGIAACALAPLAAYALAPLPAPVARGHSDAAPPIRGVLTAAALLSALTFLYLGTEVGFAGWAFTYIRQASRAAVTLAAWAPAAFWLSLSASSLGAALRPRAWRAEWVVLLCSVGALAVAVLFVAAHGKTYLEIVAAALLGLCLGPIYPLSLGSAATLAPRAAGRVSSLVVASSQLGGTLLPWLQGALLAFGTHWSMGLTLAGCAGMALLQAALLRGARLG